MRSVGVAIIVPAEVKYIFNKFRGGGKNSREVLEEVFKVLKEIGVKEGVCSGSCEKIKVYVPLRYKSFADELFMKRSFVYNISRGLAYLIVSKYQDYLDDDVVKDFVKKYFLEG